MRLWERCLLVETSERYWRNGNRLCWHFSHLRAIHTVRDGLICQSRSSVKWQQSTLTEILIQASPSMAHSPRPLSQMQPRLPVKTLPLDPAVCWKSSFAFAWTFCFSSTDNEKPDTWISPLSLKISRILSLPNGWSRTSARPFMNCTRM